MNSLSYTFTVRASALSPIAENYESLEMTWDSAITEGKKGTKMRTHIRGVAADGEI